MNTTECPSCAAAAPPGTRWCAVCRSHLTDPEADRLASPGDRLQAAVVDAIILFDAFVLIPLSWWSFLDFDAPTEAVVAALTALYLAVMVAYVSWVLHLFTRGMTPGKFVLGLQVVEKDGNSARFVRMLVREWIGKPISGAIGLLGCVWILLDRGKQGWHDKLTSTFVVEARHRTKELRLSLLGINAAILGALLLPALTSFNRAPVAVVPQAPERRANLGDTITVNMARLFRDPNGDRLSYATRVSDNSVVNAWSRGSTLRIVAVGAGMASVTVRATDPERLSASVVVPLTVGFSVCDRTPEVSDAIVRATGAASCSVVTDEQLAGIRVLDLTPPLIFDAHLDRDVYGNMLESLPEGVFAGLSGLESLNLDVNSLTSLPEGVFAGLSSLASLGLSENNLSSLPEGVFAGLSNLESLDLGSNDLTTLPEGVFAGLSGLESLNLNFNSLTSLPEGVFAGLSGLESLNLNFNSLTSLPEGVFAGLSGLESLNLDVNSLTSLPEGVFAGLSGLESLNLDVNSLTSLPEGVFAGLSNLESLDLAGNDLTALPEGVFAGLSSLASLGLSENNLSSLPEGVFAGLSSLEELHLLGNDLTTLPRGVFANLSRLEALNLTRNPGSPFPLALGFERTDGGVTSSRVASVRLTLSEGAPFAVTVPLSVAGGASTVSSATLAAGSTAGPEFKLTQTSPGRAVRLTAGRLPAIPEGFTGITLSAPAPLDLFGGAVGAAPPEAKRRPPSRGRAGEPPSTENGVSS